MKIRIKEAEVNKEDELVSQLKSQMSSLIRNIDTTLTDNIIIFSFDPLA